MSKKLIILLLLVTCSLVSYSQPKGFSPVAANAEFKSKMAQSAKNTNSIKSDFVQEKNLNVLSEKITSKGEFLFKKQNKVKMEYVTPFKYLLIINGDKVMIKDSQKSNSFSAKSNKLFTIINNIIIDCVQGTALDNKEFSSVAYKNEKNYLILLTPVKKELKEYFESISVYLDIKDCSVSKIDMLEPTGDNTLIHFNNKEINVNIPDAEFNIN